MTTSSLVQVLAVDDDPVSLAYICHVCRSMGMECSMASSAREAMACMEAHAFSIVIADWNMPDLTGLDLCKSIRNMSVQAQPYFILISDQEGDSFIKECIGVQVDQFISKPIPASVLKRSLNNAQKWTALQRCQQHLGSDIDKVRERLESDLKYVRRAQAQVIPRNGQRIGCARVSVYSRPCGIMSSDLLSVFQADDEHLAFFHVDVPGEGVSSALRTFGFSRLVSPVFGESLIFRPEGVEPGHRVRSPSEVLHALNERYVNSVETVGPVSAIYGVFNRTSRMLSVSIAGMAPPVLLIDGEPARVLGASQSPLGIGPQRYSEFTKKLNAGDRVVLYSPALVSLKGSHDEPLRPQGLCALLNSRGGFDSPDLAEHVASLVQGWLGCRFDQMDIQDDLSVLSLGFLEDDGAIEVPRPAGMDQTPESVFVGRNPEGTSLGLRDMPRGLGFVAGVSNKKRRAVLLLDDKAMTSNLVRALQAQDFELQSLPTDYFMRADDPVFNELDFVFIESSDRSFRAAKWVQLITDLKLLKRPHMVCCYQQNLLHNSVELGNLGADAFMQFPANPAQVEFVVHTGLRQLALRHAVEQQSRVLKRLTAHVESDLQTLAQMQSRILPGKLEGLDALSFKWIYKPAETVSGDFLNLFRINESQVGFYVLDAVGQGVKAAIKGWSVARMMSEMDQSCRADGGLESPAWVLGRLNASLMAMPSEYELSCSMVCGVLNCFTGHGVLAYAGFPPAFISGPDGRVCPLPGLGPKLGLEPDASYEDIRFFLHPQERLSVYSDGLPQMLGVFQSTELMTEEFKVLLSRVSQGSLKEFVAGLNERLTVSQSQQSRDVSLLTLELEASSVVGSKELNILELLDRYFPIMGQAGLNGRLPDTGRIFQASLTSGGVSSLAELLRDYVVAITGSESMADQFKRGVLKLGLDVQRQPRFERRRGMALQVAVMRSDALLVCVVSDDAKVMDLEALRAVALLETGSEEGVGGVFDHVSYHSEAGDNNFCVWKVIDPQA